MISRARTEIGYLLYQSLRIKQRTPTGIHQHDPFLHLRERLRIQDVMRAWHQGAVEADDVTLGQKIVELVDVGDAVVLCGRGVWVRVLGDDVGAHAQGQDLAG